uniref:Peptidase S1 domain-containing protein n=1 Tax=Monopterus albus TaxID=43700 RepID=A0A3Q3K0I2_MONAL
MSSIFPSVGLINVCLNNLSLSQLLYFISCPTLHKNLSLFTVLFVSPAVVCGQAPLNPRILGGSSVVTAGVWPWMASLQWKGRHVCGGTLVAVDSVLSNANCFSNSPIASEWTVVLGRLKQNGTNPNEVTLKVTNITLSNLTGSNVAVLHLEARPTLTNFIQPICLDNGRTFAVGSKCWATGWSSGQGGGESLIHSLTQETCNFSFIFPPPGAFVLLNIPTSTVKVCGNPSHTQPPPHDTTPTYGDSFY